MGKDPHEIWSYEKPEELFIKHEDTGQIVAYPTAQIPEDLEPPVWFQNAYWMHNKFLTKRLVMAYLKREPLHKSEYKRFKTYIFSFILHIAIMNWVFNPNEVQKVKYLNHNRPFLQELRELYKADPPTRAQVEEMINLCLEKGFDPL